MFQLKLAEVWWRNLLGDSSRVGEGEGKELHLCLFHFLFFIFSAGVRLGTAGCLANWVRAANEESAAAQITRFARLDSHTLLLTYSSTTPVSLKSHLWSIYSYILLELHSPVTVKRCLARRKYVTKHHFLPLQRTHHPPTSSCAPKRPQLHLLVTFCHCWLCCLRALFEQANTLADLCFLLRQRWLKSAANSSSWETVPAGRPVC